MFIQGPFLHDLPTSHVDENAITLHAVKLGGADQAASGTGKRRTDYQQVGRLQELTEPLRCSDPVHLLIGPAVPVDGVHPHADATLQPPSRGSDAAKAEDSADPAREHAVLRELIKLAKFEVSVLQDQALGGGKCHCQRVLSHRLGVAAAVGCHWHPLWELAQRNEVHATDHELDQPRAGQQRCFAGPQLFGGIECQEHAGVAQRFGAGRLIELGEIYDIACAGEGVGNDCLTRLAQLEGDDERWSAQLHAPQITATPLAKPCRIAVQGSKSTLRRMRRIAMLTSLRARTRCSMLPRSENWLSLAYDLFLSTAATRGSGNARSADAVSRSS